ncbi:MAG: ABC transporter permease [Pyrinomonadaceae bacterium]
MKTFWQDIRFGGRMLRKNPGFTIVAVLSLALGIGANAAIFQLLNAVRLRNLPVRAPQELVEIRISDMTGARGSFSSRYNAVTNPIWEQIRDRQQSFSGVFAWGQQTFNLAQGGEVRPAKALWVSGEFFNTLGVTPVAGRLFNSADDARGCSSPGVVISHPFWQREYGGDPNVIGRKLTLANFPFEIIGVTPPSFFGMEVGQSFDLALPICSEALIAGKNNRLDSATNWWLMVTGRLKPGVSLEQATSELQNMSPNLFQTTLAPNYPPVSVKSYLDMRLEATGIAGGYSGVRENYERPLWLLLAIGALVLLIACANLANLLLARATSREREMAVRQALGASRGKLVRQLLSESLLLAAMGALLGVFLAQFLSQFLVSFISTTNNKIFLDLALDWRVLGFTAFVATLTCVLFGLTPALRATRIEPGAAMKTSGRGLTGGGGKFSLRRALVVVQVALSLVLVASALLFTRSLNKLMAVDAGFRSEGILISSIGFRQLELPPERRVTFKREMLDRIKAIPGVESASETNVIPLSGAAAGNNVWLDGSDAKGGINSSFSWIGSDYFKTLGTPLVAGRELNEHDASNSTKVAVVNETFARKLFHDANPVGRRFWIEETPTDPETPYEVVGVVRNTKYGDLREEFGPIAFLALSQQSVPAPNGQFLIRSNLSRSEISAALKRTLAEINPSITVNFLGFKTMIEESLLRERLMATLSGFFGLLALLLASIGLYGILSYGVASRTKEIGIRMALGAQSREVLGSVLREAFVLVLIGVAVGLPIVFLATRFANTLLFGLTPTDPISLVLSGVLLCAVALVAGYMPARRATKVNPLVALRYE